MKRTLNLASGEFRPRRGRAHLTDELARHGRPCMSFDFFSTKTKHMNRKTATYCLLHSNLVYRCESNSLGDFCTEITPPAQAHSASSM